jgi:sporulation protein YlmC with PRC-barrel domain
MAQMMAFRIGADASCTDGAGGQVSRIIVNPITREVTHLAVDPRHRRGAARLVPFDLVDATTGQIRLRCPLAEFQTLRLAQETESVPDLDATTHTYYANDRKSGLRTWMYRNSRGPETLQQVTVDSVPSGAVEIHHDLTVSATDGDIGQVQGLIVESFGHQVTHVLLQEGHMQGRKEVAIPIDAVTKIGTLLIHLSLTRHQVKDLPPVGH